MARIEIDATAQLGVMLERAMLEKTTRETVTLRFTNREDRERFSALLTLANGSAARALDAGADTRMPRAVREA